MARTLTDGRTRRWLKTYDRVQSPEQFAQNFMAFANRFRPESADVDKADGDAQGDTHAYMSLANQSLVRRRFFCTQKSWPGLGPECMRMDDIVVVFHGGVSLYVLRPVKGREDEYFLIDECYVDILMDEGAYKMFNEREVEQRVFHLV